MDDLRSQTLEGLESVYSGMSGRTKLKIIVYQDRLFIDRSYNRQIKLSWAFNPEGRIDFVEFLAFGNNDLRTLVETESFGKEPYDWWEGVVKCNPTPEEIFLVNKKLQFLQGYHAYQLLMRYGHGTALDLVRNLESGNIGEDDNPHGRRKKFNELLWDGNALEVLAKAGEIIPSVYGKGPILFRVEYSLNERCKDQQENSKETCLAV